MRRLGSGGESRRFSMAKLVAYGRRKSSLRLGESRCLIRGLRLLGRMGLACCALLPGTEAQQQSSSEPLELALLLGKPAPPFVVTTLAGKQVSLADYKGKTLIVNFWATWCGACKLEMPWLAQLREQYAPQGFEVLGIVTDNAPTEKIAALTQKYIVKYPIFMCNHKTAQAYGGLPDLPESFFIDRHGRIIAEITAVDSKEELEEDIQRALRARN
jgi:thiol-disulfide isomerase/thioredoxin